MNTMLRRPGRQTQHTISVTLRLADHQADYGAVAVPAVVSVLWGRAAGSIGAHSYDPGTLDEVSFVHLQPQISPASLARALERAVRSYVVENGEQCVRLVENAS